ncbi:ribosome-associated translation inhibitor RaiA [Nocardiopsis mwathae]|uniref:Ribosome-associated translation inhibitor RaiA n=1 Tax=Nocardiopsis mwathae TaxID=1472723 RepID=A0A7X0D525_9ACTN|nr:HPF/RaiA family ribosome-associated protein [Nocardiopsis mwathae]MBB6171932.1 ribosome-associated translation inhibitor RaiA [Nocardiopsis mwathae]
MDLTRIDLRNAEATTHVGVIRTGGVDDAALAHIRDRFEGVSLYSAVPLYRVSVTVGCRKVPVFGRVVRVEVHTDRGADTVSAEAEGDSVFTAVDKARDRLCMELAGHDVAEAVLRPAGTWARMKAMLRAGVRQAAS